MIYTRDSIMREILSDELADFCISYASKYECNCLEWSIPINLNHDEITEILSNYAEYGDNYNLFLKKNDEYYVDTTYLIYRTARSDENGINIFPDLTKFDPQIQKILNSRLVRIITGMKVLSEKVSIRYCLHGKLKPTTTGTTG